MMTWPAKKPNLEKHPQGMYQSIAVHNHLLMSIIQNSPDSDDGNNKTYKPQKTPAISEDESSGSAKEDSDVQEVSAPTKTKKPVKKKGKVSF